MHKFSSAVIAIIFSLVLPVSAGSFILQDYNLITIGDFSSNSDVEGQVFVGGNFTGTNSVNIGIHLNASFDGTSLQVAGKLYGSDEGANGTININGDVEVGSSNTVTTYDNGNKYEVNGRMVGDNQTNVTTNADLTTISIDYQNELESASATFAAETPTNSVVTSGNITTLDVGDNSYSVFDLGDLSDFFTNTANQTIEIAANDFDSVEAIIINVGGTDLEIANSSTFGNSFINNADIQSKIIWNFYEASTIELNAQAFYGSLLAPFATVISSNFIQGSVGVFSLLTTGEVHLPTTTVSLPTTQIPEPSSLILFALAMLWLYSRRKTLFIPS